VVIGLFPCGKLMKKGFVGSDGFGGTKACFDFGAATLEALWVSDDCQ
jgi:hypothetical protein